MNIGSEYESDKMVLGFVYTRKYVVKSFKESEIYNSTPSVMILIKNRRND